MIRVLLIFLFMLTGCAEERPLKPAPAFTSPQASTEVSIKPLSRKKDVTDIEITLVAPESPIDGFILHWGASPSNLDQTQKVTLDKLIKAPSSDGKPLYSYILREVKNSDSLYVSISSYIGDTVSPSSTPVEVK